MTYHFAVLVVALARVSWGAFSGGGGTERPEDAVADRIKVVRATYEKLPPAILGVEEPIRVTQCIHQRVPVVVNLIFTDSDGTNHHFSWWLDKGKFLNAEYDRIDWVRYIGPGPIGAKRFRLPVRGPEEDALYGLLLRWSATKGGAKDLSPFDRQMLEEVNRLLEKLDVRLAGDKPVLQAADAGSAPATAAPRLVPAAKGKPPGVTRPVPINAGGTMIPSPFYISVAEHEINKRASVVRKEARPETREFVLLETIKAIQANDLEQFQALAIPAEQERAAKLMRLHQMMFKAKKDPLILYRLDYGKATYFVVESGNPNLPAAMLIVREVDGRLGWSPQAMLDPMGQILSDLCLARFQDPKTFAPVADPDFQETVSVMPLDGEEEANPVYVSFHGGCRADFIAYDKDGAVAEKAPNCPADVNAALQFYRDTWRLLARNQIDDFRTRFSSESANRIESGRPHKISVEVRRSNLQHREVPYVVAGNDTYVLFYEISGGFRRTGHDIVRKRPDDNLEITYWNVEGSFELLLRLSPLKERLAELTQPMPK